jgi:hypothetical protein
MCITTHQLSSNITEHDIFVLAVSFGRLTATLLWRSENRCFRINQHFREQNCYFIILEVPLVSIPLLVITIHCTPPRVFI